MVRSRLLTVRTKGDAGKRSNMQSGNRLLRCPSLHRESLPKSTDFHLSARARARCCHYNEARQASFVTATSTSSTAMTADKHPIAHQWIKQTLVPFLLFAFIATLPYPADISEEIQRSIDFALVKPDHHSDGDDVIFERIFMAIMHRHKNLAPDLTMVVDNLELCATYLIRRAQLKGPFELLGRTDIGSSAWMEHEGQRLSNLLPEHEEAEDGALGACSWKDYKLTMRRASKTDATILACIEITSHRGRS